MVVIKKARRPKTKKKELDPVCMKGAADFIHECYELRTRSRIAERKFIKSKYKDIFGDPENKKTPTQLLKARIFYSLALGGHARLDLFEHLPDKFIKNAKAILDMTNNYVGLDPDKVYVMKLLDKYEAKEDDQKINKKIKRIEQMREDKQFNGIGRPPEKIVFGTSVTSVIRSLAAKGFGSKEIKLFLDHKQITVSKSLVYVNVSRGRHSEKGRPPAKLKKIHLDEFRTFVKNLKKEKRNANKKTKK